MEKLLYMPGDQKQPSGNQLVTLDDLEKFRVKLLTDMRTMLEGHLAKSPKRWLKSKEVRKILNISGGTLQTLRNNRKLPFTRIGGLIYYDAAEIDHLLSNRDKIGSAVSSLRSLPATKF